MAWAKSPGSMVTVEKMMIETANIVTTPSTRRCTTVLTTAFMAPSTLARARGAGIGPPPGTLPCLGEPPTLGDLQAIGLPVRSDRGMGQLLRIGLHIVVEDKHDDTAIVMEELLHLGVHLGTLLVVGFAARRDQHVVELRIGVVGLVPRRTLGIDGGEQPVAGRSAGPNASAPRLLEPDIVPVAVIRLPDDVEVDTGRLGVLLVEYRRVDRSVEGGFGDGQIDLEVREARLLQVELRLFRVIGIARLGVVGELDAGRDRIVVPGLQIGRA